MPRLAELLTQANPTIAGWTVALLSGPVLLAADALDKRIRQSARGR